MGKRWRPPLAPVAGVQSEVQSAIADKIDVPTVAILLATYRTFKGRPADTKATTPEATAKAALIRGLRWIVYDSSQGKYDYCYSHWGSLFCALDTAVTRLRDNNVAATEAEKRIRDEFCRTMRRYRRELSRHIYPKDSTNSERRKAGKQPYPMLRHNATIPRQHRDGKIVYVDPLHDGEALKAARRMSDPGQGYVDAFDAVTRTHDERWIMQLKCEGNTERQIAEKVGVTRHEVRNTLSAVKQRAELVLVV